MHPCQDKKNPFWTNPSPGRMQRVRRLKRCRPYRVTLQEGDVLYMPAFWHHEVRMLDFSLFGGFPISMLAVIH